MHKDISMTVRFNRDDAHRTGLPKYHIGASSKRRPEAAGRGGGSMKGQGVDDEMGITYLRSSTGEISPTDMNKQIQRSLQFFKDVFVDVFRYHYVLHELMNC